MRAYQLYHRYAAKFGHTFEEKSLSERGWQAALVLMQYALENVGLTVTTVTIGDYLKALPRPIYA